MQQQDSTKVTGRDKAVFFKVQIFPDRLAAIYQRRRNGDQRPLAQWLDDGLELALQGKEPKEQRQVVESGHMREIELFCALVARGPDALFGIWYWLWRRVGSDPNFWLFPSYTEDDELNERHPEPFLDKDALSDAWGELLSAAEIRANARPI